MWDWELLKNGSGQHRYEIIDRCGDEDFQYTHAISYGSQEDEFCLHNHAMYELVYCIGGDVVYLAEGVRYSLAPNSLLVINPTVPHKLFICSDVPFERHILYIYYAGRTSGMASMMARCQPPVGDKRVGSAYYPPEDAGGMIHILARIDEASSSEDEEIRGLAPLFVQALVAELTMMMRRKKPEKYSVGTSKTVDTMLLYLSRNYTKNLSLPSIAETFHLSRDYCNRLFHDSTGMTVMQYVIYSRVLYAKQLLADGTPASDVARMVGYDDYSTFYRAYRKITGRPPKADHEIAEPILESPLIKPEEEDDGLPR